MAGVYGTPKALQMVKRTEDQRGGRALQNSKVVAPFLCFYMLLRTFSRFNNEKVSFVTA